MTIKQKIRKIYEKNDAAFLYKLGSTKNSVVLLDEGQRLDAFDICAPVFDPLLHTLISELHQYDSMFIKTEISKRVRIIGGFKLKDRIFS